MSSYSSGTVIQLTHDSEARETAYSAYAKAYNCAYTLPLTHAMHVCELL